MPEIEADINDAITLQIATRAINPAIKYAKLSGISDARMPEINTDPLGA